MPRITIDPSALSDYTNTLKKLDVGAVEEVLEELEDVAAREEEDPIRVSDLPTAVPASVRRQIADLSAQRIRLGRQINTLLDRLAEQTSDIWDEKSAEWERSRPHCHHCGQVLPRGGKGAGQATEWRGK